jgi:hypothetical protein
VCGIDIERGYMGRKDAATNETEERWSGALLGISNCKGLERRKKFNVV